MISMAKKRKDYGTGIPEHEVEALARCLLPEIQKFFESEEGKREFEEWKKEQENKAKGCKRHFGIVCPEVPFQCHNYLIK